MSQRSPATLAGPSLFRHCAEHSDNAELWKEFIRRYNPLLVRSVIYAWRKCGQGNFPPQDLAEDLLQDVYLKIVKHQFRLLQNFQGNTEEEANAYLARTAINQTISYLRPSANKMGADEISLDEWIEGNGEDRPLPLSLTWRQQRLSENELIEILEKCFDGVNRNRDVLVFLLRFRDGYNSEEISKMGFCALKVTSINNLLVDLKKKLRKFFTEDVKSERN